MSYKFCKLQFRSRGHLNSKELNTYKQQIRFFKIFFWLFLFLHRVINAGKSTHNEDQASCEVLMVKKKIGTTNSTPNRNSSSKRRSSLPNGEGLQLKENSVSLSIFSVIQQYNWCNIAMKYTTRGHCYSASSSILFFSPYYKSGMMKLNKVIIA